MQEEQLVPLELGALGVLLERPVLQEPGELAAQTTAKQVPFVSEIIKDLFNIALKSSFYYCISYRFDDKIILRAKCNIFTIY